MTDRREPAIEEVARALEELDHQAQQSSFLTQELIRRSFGRLTYAETVLTQLLQALSVKGVITQADLQSALAGEEDDQLIEERPVGQPTVPWPSIAVRADKPEEELEPPKPVDCSARLHLCKAVCCSLKVPLTIQEVELGRLKWDLGHPYMLRQDRNGYCTHNTPGTHGCEVYEDRPLPCRQYSCVDDERIWLDFDNMVLNEEWIKANTGASNVSFGLQAAEMLSPEVTTSPGSFQ